MKLYGFNPSSPCNKVRYVANYLNIQYEYIIINPLKGENQRDFFKQLTPIRKIPVLEDNGLIVFESNAIIRYLAEKMDSPIYPKNIERKVKMNQWIDFITIHLGYNALGKVFGNRVIYPRIGIEPDERAVKEGTLFLNQFLPIIESELKSHRYIAGEELTLADFVLIAVLDPLEVLDIDVSSYERLCEYRSHLMGQNFYQQCHKEYAQTITSED